jgi:hypothetical protein
VRESRHSGIRNHSLTKMPQKTLPLYNALYSWIGQLEDWAHLSHLTTCIWLVIAVIHTGSVNLTKWVSYIPNRGVFAQSTQRRIQRWLYNPRINIHRLYKPLIQAALADWHDPDIFLALDTSLFWDEYCLVRLCVGYRGRALPVVWRVLEHRSASVAFEDYQQMIQQAVSRLPNGKRVVLLADRGFIRQRCKRFKNMVCVSIWRRIFWTINPMVGIFNVLKFVRW